jgi:multisubunit Na+/H+ antiporter MnhF subunit
LSPRELAVLVLLALGVGVTLLSCLGVLVMRDAYDRAIYFDLALALALLSFAGGLVFARFLERWI